MKVVLDMVLNHTSDQHRWFVESRAGRDSPRRDWYLWRDGRKPGGAAPPNNWRSMLGGSGWHYHPPSGQWYWASFLPFQPDLNYRNPHVKRAMLDMVRHWLREGADGLRLDIFNALYKDGSFADNPFSFRPVPSEDNPDGFFQRNRHTVNHPDTVAFARELRAVVEEFRDPPRFVVGEVFGSTPVLRDYLGNDAGGLHLVFLFKAMKTPFRAHAFRSLLAEFEREFQEPLHPTWVFGNHDRPRSIARLGNHPGRARLLAMLQLTARGVPFIYYGEEIGMRQLDLPLAGARDPVAARFRFVPDWLARRLRGRGILLNRDECRPPMQWEPGGNAGFSPPGATPWLPVHPSAREVNVAAQHGDTGSLLACYRRLLALRRGSPALHAGSLTLMDASQHPKDVLAYRRRHEGAGGSDEAAVLLNFSPRGARLDLGGFPGRRLVSNLRHEEMDSQRHYELLPYEGIVLLGRREAAAAGGEA
jgi:glycosidase